jgi:hypothetical protein
MVNFRFDPDPATVNVGDTVTWTNKSSLTHTSTSGMPCTADNIWNSGNIGPSSSFSFTFDAAGSYPYFCIPHCASGMTGTVVVNEGGTNSTTVPGTTTTVSGTTTTTTVSGGITTTTTPSVSTTTTTIASTCPLKKYLSSQEDVQSLRDVRERLMLTYYGSVLVTMYYQHAFEISFILARHPFLQDDLKRLVKENREGIREFIETGSARISSGEEKSITDFLNTLKNLGSDNLKSDIDSLMQDIQAGYLWNNVFNE